MSVTASPARATASCAAATNDRPTGNRRNSDVCDNNTRRGGEPLGITHSIPALTHREDTKSQADSASPAHTGPSGAPSHPVRGRDSAITGFQPDNPALTDRDNSTLPEAAL